jgi:predicted SnoaL-like aldol condensation-catalyzing enzyme
VRGAAALSFLRLATAGEVDDAYQRHVAPGFRHHNPYFPGDAESLADAMKANASEHPHKVLDVRHVLEDGEYVAVHGCVRLDPEGPDIALVQIFRFAEDRIIESWDVGQAVPDESSNENGMF